MAGHHVTPYELTATRRHARKDKEKRLLLASTREDSPVDLLTAIETHLLEVDPIKSHEENHTLRPVLVERDGDVVSAVFSLAIRGERELVRDPDQEEGRPAIFVKDRKHAAIYYSLVMVWRPPAGERGIVMIHSPWGRGGSRAQVTRALQAAANLGEAKAKLATAPIVPQSVLERYLRQAEATRIVYRKSSGVKSTFDKTQGEKSAPAEMDLVIKGSNSKPFRDALAAALRASANREKFFTLDVRSSDGTYEAEVFDDVEVAISSTAGVKTYSMREGTIPTIGYNLTPEINNVYYALPEDEQDKWPALLLAGVKAKLTNHLREVSAGL